MMFTSILRCLIGLAAISLASSDTIRRSPTKQRRELNYFFSDIPTALEVDSRFDTLALALNLTNLDDVLACDTWRFWLCSSFTVFAPRDQVLSGDSVSDVIGRYTTDLDFLPHLRAFLLHHVAAGEVFGADIQDGGTIETLSGETVRATIEGTTVRIDNVLVREGDIDAKNGVIHELDGVLLPSFATSNILDVAGAEAVNSTIFATAVAESNSAGPLENRNKMTVFVPTNEAFAAVADIVEGLTVAEIGEIIQYHIIDAAILTVNDVETASVETLQGENLEFLVHPRNSELTLNINTKVVESDILASNGIIHVIDQVLLPPSIATRVLPTIADVVKGSDDFSVLQAALDSVDLVEALSAPGAVTVFAPTDAAFAKLGDAVLDLLGTADLANILQYHVLPSVVLSRDIESGYIESASGALIGVSVAFGEVYLNENVHIETYDIQTSNGIVHVIDTVLIPKTIVEVAAEQGLDALVEAIDYVEGLRDALSDTNGYITVFAPSNTGFKELEKLSKYSEAFLLDVLTYHVVPGLVIEDDIREGDIATLSGKAISVEFYQPWWGRWWYEPQVYITSPTVNARLRRTDIYAANGVIHVISEVLIPPS